MRAKVLRVAEEEGLRAHAEGLDEERDEHRQLVARAVDADLRIGKTFGQQVLQDHAVGGLVHHTGQTGEHQGRTEGRERTQQRLVHVRRTGPAG